MKRTLVAISMAALISTVGCQKGSSHASDQNPPAPTQNVQPKSLSSLSAQDTVTTKYDKAVVSCHLEFPLQIQQRSNGEQTTGTDSFQWDLLNDYSETKTVQLKAQSLGITAILDVQFSKIEIFGNVSVQDEATGSSYSMQYSPVISGKYQYSFDKPIVIGTGVVSHLNGQGPITLYEGVENKLLNEKDSSSLQDGSAAYNMELHLTCLLDVKIKPEYQDQFVKNH